MTRSSETSWQSFGHHLLLPSLPACSLFAALVPAQVSLPPEVFPQSSPPSLHQAGEALFVLSHSVSHEVGPWEVLIELMGLAGEHTRTPKSLTQSRALSLGSRGEMDSGEQEQGIC